MNSYPANSLTGPLLYLPTSITLLSSESVAVRAWGSTVEGDLAYRTEFDG
jgi:hypothetical protein